jgi:phospholipase/carboxylesterase
MGEILPCVELEPRDGDVRASVIWLHGLGASGHDFEPVVPLLAVPHTRFIFPHAPERPVTINAGMRMPAWYDILSLENSSSREPEEDVAQSAALIRALIDHERERGIPAQKIVVAGFSQGGALALHTATRYPDTLAGIMVLSAYALQERGVVKAWEDAQKSTPFFFGHGRRDEVVPPKRGRRAWELIHGGHQAPELVRWHDYPMGHEVCVEQLTTVGAWLRECLLEKV